jgi:tetratricopeptide (TPR) repeat protein
MVLEYTQPWEALEITCQVIDNWQVYAGIKGPECAYWYFLLARLSDHTGGQNRLGISAIDAIERALAFHPNEPRWHSIAAEYLSHHTNEGSEADSRARAKNHLDTAIQIEPDFAYHYYAMAKILRDEAQIGSAIENLKKASELAPLSSDIRLFLAKIQFENGDLENAAINTDIAIENSTDLIEALLLRGEISLMIGDPKDAQTKAQSILDLDPGHLEALQLYARSLNALDQPEEALEIMAKVIPQVEKPLPLELERAQWFCETEPTTESVIELRNLIQRYPQEPLFKAYLAEILDRQHQGEAAILISRQALQNSDLGLPAEKQAQLHLIIGKNSHESGQLDHAIHHLCQALDLNPANLEAYFELGRTYQTRRNYQEAAKTYQNAIHIAPKDYRPYYYAGLALKEAKEYQSSEAMLRRAIELSPGEKSIRKQLGAVIALNFVHNGRSAIFPTQSK